MESVTRSSALSWVDTCDHRAVTLVPIGGVVLVAWLILAMQGPGTHTEVLTPSPHTLTLLGLAIASLMWMTMMVAMMLPSVTPWILAYASTNARSGRGRPWRTAAFVGGYFTIWGAFSIGAAIIQILLVQHGLMRAVLAESPTRIGAALLILAGVYQWTATKLACLEHCRSPVGFFLSSWRRGTLGALRMGVEHGAYCLGCCWALMVLSFPLGVMNLLWMAIVSVVLCVEKVAKPGVFVGRIFGAGLVVWGVWLALRLTP